MRKGYEEIGVTEVTYLFLYTQGILRFVVENGHPLKIQNEQKNKNK
jgi:hypothetical protein